jgi:hypothetical protein
MAEQTRNSVMAIMEESTEGTPVIPSGATDFVALQDGFKLSPSFNVLESAEIRASIGKAKPITGLESPKASFNHYLRHSGVEGTAPNYKKLLKAAFGTETVNGTQYTTASSSSVSVVKVGTGNGANFTRGQALLVKDGTNGYSIRPVLSVSTDDLNLGFNLANAPASGIGLGKAVMYSPANSGHPTLSVWEYRGNGGAIEMIAGARVTEMGLDIKAGDLIQGSYSLEGVKYHFNPINITSSTKYIDFLDNATTRAASITAKVYRDPIELATAIQDAMNALGSSNTFTCTYSSSTGKFTITSTGSTLTMKWNTGSNTANSIASKIGFSTAADSTGALTYTSTTAQSWAAPYTPSYDSADPLVAKDNEVLLGGATDTTAFSASSLSFKLTDNKSNILDISAASGVSGSVINQRQVSVDVTGLLTRHEADKFKRFRANDDTSFLFNFGTKSGGNWQAGKCGCLYIPTCTISNFELDDLDGLVVVKMTLNGFVDSSGNGEVYLNFV